MLKKRILMGMLLCGALSAFPLYKTFIAQPENRIDLSKSATQEQIQATVTQITQGGSTIAKTLAQQLNDEKNRLLCDLQKEFTFKNNAWQEALEDLSEIKANDTLLCDNPQITPNEADHEIVKKVKTLLVEYGINPSKVTIYTVNEPENGSFASAGQGYDNQVIHELKINLAQLSCLTPVIQEAIIRHEIIHLLYYDPLEHSFIVSLFAEQDISPDLYRQNFAFSAYCKHKELRADLMAIGNNLAMARAFQEDFLNRFKENPHCFTKVYASHPSLQHRYETINILAEYLHAEKKALLA